MAPFLRPVRPEELPRFHELVNQYYAPLKFAQIEARFAKDPQFLLVHGDTISQYAVMLGPWRSGSDIGAMFLFSMPSKLRREAILFSLGALRDAGFTHGLSPLLTNEEVQLFREAGFQDKKQLEFFKFSRFSLRSLLATIPKKHSGLKLANNDFGTRSMVPSDLGPVAEIDRSSFAGIWTYGLPELQEMFAYSVGICATDENGQIVGSVIYSHSGQTGVVVRLSVDQRLRRRGVGSLLLRSAIDELTNKGVKDISLCTQSDNLTAKVFYQMNGFKKISGKASLMIIGL